jgi:hypothetical protein
VNKPASKIHRIAHAAEEPQSAITLAAREKSLNLSTATKASKPRSLPKAQNFAPFFVDAFVPPS